MAGCLRLGALQQVKAARSARRFSSVIRYGQSARQKDGIDHMDHTVGLHDIGNGDF